MQSQKKRNVRIAAIFATVITVAASACAFTPWTWPRHVHSWRVFIGTMGYAFLWPGILVDGALAGANNLGKFMYLAPPVSWIVYFALFYGAGRLLAPKPEELRPRSASGAATIERRQ
jgi:hypothetical protein